MNVNWKILKWCLPVISYLIYIGLFYLWDGVDRLIWSVMYNESPRIFPYYFVGFFTLPLILCLYVILPIAQWIHMKSRKWFKIFAWSIMAITLILLIIFVYNQPCYLLYALVMVFPKPLLYYGPFFLILSYILKRKKNIAVSV
jgi:hypothetical protein